MMPGKILPVLLLMPLALSSCFEEDERVAPYPGTVYTINDSIQKYQSYFDLESGTVIKTHRADRWQLGFECGEQGWHIIVNSGDNWFIYDTRQTDMDADVSMPDGTEGLYDVQQAFPDSTATGKWVIPGSGNNTYSNHCYLLGKLAGNGFSDIKKIKFLELSDTSYKFYYKEISGAFSDTVVITKTDSVNYVYYRFESHSQINLEPDKTTYDLMFGPYYDLATQFGLTIPYLVGGALLNPWNTQSYLDSIHDYAFFDFNTLNLQNMNSQRDIPGYRWKSVNVDVSGSGSALYMVKPGYIYLIRTAQYNVYKLRFLSYTLDGKSGFPRFEYRQLSPVAIIPQSR